MTAKAASGWHGGGDHVAAALGQLGPQERSEPDDRAGHDEQVRLGPGRQADRQQIGPAVGQAPAELAERGGRRHQVGHGLAEGGVGRVQQEGHRRDAERGPQPGRPQPGQHRDQDRQSGRAEHGDQEAAAGEHPVEAHPRHRRQGGHRHQLDEQQALHRRTRRFQAWANSVLVAALMSTAPGSSCTEPRPSTPMRPIVMFWKRLRSGTDDGQVPGRGLPGDDGEGVAAPLGGDLPADGGQAGLRLRLEGRQLVQHALEAVADLRAHDLARGRAQTHREVVADRRHQERGHDPDGVLEAVGAVDRLVHVEHDQRTGLEGVDVVADHEVAGLGRRLPVDEAQVVAHHVLAEVVEGDAALGRLARGGTFEVTGPAVGEGSHVVGGGVHPQRLLRLLLLTHPHELERVGPADRERSDLEDAPSIGGQPVGPGVRAAPGQRRNGDRDDGVPEVLEHDHARAAAAATRW